MSTTTKKEGLKADGTLKKGFRYAAGGRIVKAKAATVKKAAPKKKKATTAKKKTAGKKKKTTVKK